MDKSMKSVDKCWNDSLCFMNNIYIKIVLYVVLILYSSTYFQNINIYVGNLYKKYKFLNIIVLLLIVYLGRACPVVGILLGISYAISLNYYTENYVDEECKLIGTNPDPKYSSYCKKTDKKVHKSLACESECATKIDGYNLCCESSCCS
jgi:hypothetical protein